MLPRTLRRAAAAFGRRAPLIVACGALAGPAPAGEDTPTPPRPHVVVILADDLGYGDLGCYGARRVRTPNLDRLAAQGARFTSFYANSAVCSPTRAALLSGVLPAETGVLGALSKPRPGVGGLREGLVLLPQWLREAGYRTALFGKWHLGSEPGDLPRERGFERFFGYVSGAPYAAGERDRLLSGEEPVDAGGCITERITDAAVAFVEEHVRERGDEPFFLYVAHKAPHAPIGEGAALHPERFLEHLEAGAMHSAAEYFTVVEDLDLAVGGLLGALDEHGLTERTLVFFLSDNGPAMDQPGASSGGLRFGKGVIAEGGIRVPCIVRWPGRVEPGLEIEAPASTVDVFSTALAAAGVEAPETQAGAPLEGLDLTPVLETGRDPRLEERALFWFDRQSFAVRRGRWKLFALLPYGRLGEWGSALDAWDDGTFRLYDLEADPGEEGDRADAEPEVLAELQAELRRRLVRARDGAAPRPAPR